MNHWNGSFINKYKVIHFIFSDHFSFLVVLNKHKNKSMGNCISKISKDRLLALDEFMKNKTSLKKGKARPGLDMLTGVTYTRGASKKKNVCSTTNWGVVRRPFLKNKLTPKIFYVILKGVVHCVSPFRIIFKHFSFCKIRNPKNDKMLPVIKMVDPGKSPGPLG